MNYKFLKQPMLQDDGNQNGDDQAQDQPVVTPPVDQADQTSGEEASNEGGNAEPADENTGGSDAGTA